MFYHFSAKLWGWFWNWPQDNCFNYLMSRKKNNIIELDELMCVSK